VKEPCVGLSASRRAAANDFLLLKQGDMEADPRVRVAACWLNMEMGNTELPALTESVNWVCKPASAEDFSLVDLEFIDRLSDRVHLQHSEQTTRGGDALIAVGQMREALLKRFEELVLYGGQHIFLTVEPEEESSDTPASAELGGLMPGRSPEEVQRTTPEPPPRKFRTIYNVQVWIQQNWPEDFKPDAPRSPMAWCVVGPACRAGLRGLPRPFGVIRSRTHRAF
jgi:hypothetical protein